MQSCVVLKEFNVLYFSILSSVLFFYAYNVPRDVYVEKVKSEKY